MNILENATLFKEIQGLQGNTFLFRLKNIDSGYLLEAGTQKSMFGANLMKISNFVRKTQLVEPWKILF